MKSGLAILLLAILLPNISRAPTPSSHTTCEKSKLFTARNIIAWSTTSRARGFFYKSGMAIDADGAFRAYHPNDRLGLDSLAHAGHRGNWWALVTDNGKTNGHPVIQGQSDPAPGYYVSTTALYDPDNHNPRDPHRYVDAGKVPYVVLHPKALKHARLGDFATVVNFQNGKISPAIVADESAPNLPVGEGSIALAEALGIDSSPRNGGKDGAVAYLIYPGSGNGRPRPLQVIVANSKQLFEAWGGMDRLNACLAGE
jgi:Fungal chitosanase of glycosyl hydrolase group 75